MLNSINKIFVFVENINGKAQAYKNAYGVSTLSPTNEYYNKIAFLEETGEIVTHGKVFALNTDDDFAALTAKVHFLLNMVGDYDHSGSINGTENSLLTRVENLEALVNADESETNNVIDKLTEIIAWFNGIEESSTVTQIITDINNNKTAIGNKKTETENATGLFKYIDDRILEVTIEDSTKGSVDIPQGKHVAVQVTEKKGKLDSVTVVEDDIASATYVAALKELVGNGDDISGGTSLASRIKSLEEAPTPVHGVNGETLLDFTGVGGKEITIKSSQELKDAVDKANSAIQEIYGANYLLNVTYTGTSYTLTPLTGSISVQNGQLSYLPNDDKKLVTVSTVINTLNGLELWENY